MKYTIVILALAVGLLLGAAGHGSGPAPIDSLSGPVRWGVLVLLGVLFYAAVWRFGRDVARYHTSGDPKTVVIVDAATAQRWASEHGADPVEAPAAIGETIRLDREVRE